jgi:hypothetical protein
MSRDQQVAVRVSGPARKTLWRVLQEFVLDRLESEVFRIAFVTVLLIAAVQQFAGWKYTGLVMREITAVVQAELPWSQDEGPLNAFNAERRSVVSLVIGNDLFASKDLFKHRVPLDPGALLRLLTATRDNLPRDAWIVIDFDISPRVEDGIDQESVAARAHLDDWLAQHAARLVLLEPAWAVRHEETFGRQLAWARARCGLDEHGLPTARQAAVLAQPTIATRFGFVQDTADPRGNRSPTWDLGRAVFDHVGKSGHRRNPLCDRLRTPVRAGTTAHELPDFIKLKTASLAAELKVRGELEVPPQPIAALASHGDVVLRHDLIRMSDVEPKDLADISAAPLLKAARVVVIGGTWTFGFADMHDTFVDKQDGVRVHAAWIRSWLQPLAHLNKLADILLDAVIIEALLHPILEFAFVAIRRRAEHHEQGRGASTRRTGPGRHVVWAVVLIGIAALAVVGTALTLIVIDGVLRWCLNRMLTIDTTLLALLMWILVVPYRIASGAVKHSVEHLQARAWVSAAWLIATLAASCAVVWLVNGLPSDRAPLARVLAWGLVLLLPLAYVAFSAWRSVRAPAQPSHAGTAAQTHTAPPEPVLTPRARWRRLKRRAFRGWSSNLRALRYALATLVRLHRDPWKGANGIAARWADGVGALLWCGVWVFAIYVLFQATLWGMLVAHFGA